METYIVGGFVREKLRGSVRSNTDRDFVVVGSTPEEMCSLGFNSVGKSFPVYLHPKTGEEYALARKERKVGEKHTDFTFEFTPDISLEEDLERRDFTMNAIAFNIKDEKCWSEKLVDPFNGCTDIDNKVIRHINSEHFIEDPLRILRAARFASTLNFSIADETKVLLKDMVNSGMLSHLTVERVWKETDKVLQTASKPSIYFEVLREIGALKILFPEIDALFNTPEQIKYHPSGNTGKHTMSALDMVSTASYNNDNIGKIRFATLTHDLGKALTPKEILPSHYGHDKEGLPVIDKMCLRLKIPNDYREFALLACKYHMRFFNFKEMNIKKLYDILDDITGFKDFIIFNQLVDVFEADSCSEYIYLNPKEGFSYLREKRDIVEEIRLYMLNLYYAAISVSYKDVPNYEKYTGKLCGIRLRECRISKMKQRRREENDEGQQSNDSN